MNPASTSIAITSTLLLGAFWRRMKEPIDPPLAAARPANPPPRTAGARSHDIRDLLRQRGRESLQARLKACGIALGLELPAEPLPVLLDRSGMQEVFAQIADMACRVMPKGSTLRVLGRVDGTTRWSTSWICRHRTTCRAWRVVSTAAARAPAPRCARRSSATTGGASMPRPRRSAASASPCLPLPSQAHQFSPRSSRGALFAQEIADAEELIFD